MRARARARARARLTDAVPIRVLEERQSVVGRRQQTAAVRLVGHHKEAGHKRARLTHATPRVRVALGQVKANQTRTVIMRKAVMEVNQVPEAWRPQTSFFLHTTHPPTPTRHVRARTKEGQRPRATYSKCASLRGDVSVTPRGDISSCDDQAFKHTRSRRQEGARHVDRKGSTVQARTSRTFKRDDQTTRILAPDRTASHRQGGHLRHAASLHREVADCHASSNKNQTGQLVPVAGRMRNKNLNMLVHGGWGRFFWFVDDVCFLGDVSLPKSRTINRPNQNGVSPWSLLPPAPALHVLRSLG
jgi:hypothetical protein